MSMRIAILVSLLVSVPMAARASTSSCAGAGDGTACVTTCISSGLCMMGSCLPVMLRPDGTACSTDNRCTTGDTCLAGTCVAGSPVMCPDLSACFIGFCSPQFGCSVRNICRPDMATPPTDMATDQDMSSGPSDMSVGLDQGMSDLAEPEDLTGVPNDMCFVPIGSEFFTCNGPDGPYYIPFDAATPPDATESFHVRGSRVGDCNFGGGSVPGPSLIALLFGGVILLRRRSRRG